MIQRVRVIYSTNLTRLTRLYKKVIPNSLLQTINFLRQLFARQTREQELLQRIA